MENLDNKNIKELVAEVRELMSRDWDGLEKRLIQAQRRADEAQKRADDAKKEQTKQKNSII